MAIELNITRSLTEAVVRNTTVVSSASMAEIKGVMWPTHEILRTASIKVYLPHLGRSLYFHCAGRCATSNAPSRALILMDAKKACFVTWTRILT